MLLNEQMVSFVCMADKDICVSFNFTFNMIIQWYFIFTEFIEMGKPHSALDTLQEVFRTKRWNYAYSESMIETMMYRFLYLCVELKKPHVAKEGLFQYRNMFQLVNVNSLENVIRAYLRMAEEHTVAAQAESSAAVAVLELDDLDNITTPESILMKAVCGEDAQDRSDRTILLPWVKFLWESYCQCLELLRVNTHCEILYHDIARMTFQFCLKYNRKSEFRRLCDKLRKHLEDICKSTNQTTGVSINRAETQQLCMDTRLFQLDCAIKMELWQDAYKAIEDIHGLMALSKKTPAAKTMANYYQKLAMVFSKAGNHLFHAAALLKLFQMTCELKKHWARDDMQKMATHVLIAILSIPLPSAHPEFDRFIEADKSPLEKAQKLAILLGLPQPPTRSSLMKEMVRLNVPQLVQEDYRNLYNWLEIDFNPLNLCKRVQTVVDVIESIPGENNLLLPYVKLLKDVTVVRLIRQVSQVYESIQFSRLLELAPFCNIFELEKLLVDSVRHNDMQIRIDHQKQSIFFGTDLTESQREDYKDGPTLQSMPSEQIRSQLVNMSSVLHRAVAIIYPNREYEKRSKLRAQMVNHYHEIKVREHQRILQRQKIIEDRKEFIEKQNNAREEEEARRQEEESRKIKIAEQKRLEQENEERERKRHQNEIQAIKEKSLKEKVQQISQTALGKKMLQKLDEESIKKLDAEQIAIRENEELQRERKEMQNKLKSQEKKIDYFERCKRIKEIPLFEKYFQEKVIKDAELWKSQEAIRIESAIAERMNAVAQRERLQRMHEDYVIFMDELKRDRADIYAEKLRQFEIVLAEERKKRLAERVVQRREERKRQWLREKEEERLRKEAEARRLIEEEERAKAEARRKEREAEEEKRRIQYEKQRAKEEEAERRIQEARERVAQASRSVAAPAAASTSEWRRGAGVADRDREREREKERDREYETEDILESKDIETEKTGSWRARNDGESTTRTTAVRPTERWRRGPDTEDVRSRGEDFRRRGGDRDRDRDREFRRGGDRDIRRGGERDNLRGDRDSFRGGDRDNFRASDRDQVRGGERSNWRDEAAKSNWREHADGESSRDNRRQGDRDRDRRDRGPREAGAWRNEKASEPNEKTKDEQEKGNFIVNGVNFNINYVCLSDSDGDDGGEWTSIRRR